MEAIHKTPVIGMNRAEMRPLGWLGSLFMFGIAALVMLASFHLGIPLLEQAGVTPYEAFIVVSTVPLAVMLAAALAAVVREQNITSFAGLAAALRGRMRFPRLTLKAALLGVGLYAAMLVTGGVLGLLSHRLIQAQIIPVPRNVPLMLNPSVEFSPAALAAYVGGPLAGNWGIVILWIVRLFFNIAGEELLWRGYVLPRQELAFGRRAWLVHGLLWWGFHAYKWWDLLTVLPIALLLGYGAQRTKNNWVPTIAHTLANALLLGILIASVLG